MNWLIQTVESNLLPVDQVINNPRGDNVDRPFTAKPQWKKMVWGLDDIKAFADMEGITDVTLRENMTPEQVLDLHKRAQQNREVVLRLGQDG